MATFKVNKIKHPQADMWRVSFSWDGGELPDDTEKVNLSRHGTNPSCNFRPDQVAGHDGHTPTFKSEEECDIYITRVMADCTSALTGVEELDGEAKVGECSFCHGDHNSDDCGLQVPDNGDLPDDDGS